MCENVNINVSETNETINIVSSEIQEVIDINVFETTEDVTLNITEEIIQVNINKVTGGGGEQTLQQTLEFGNNTGGTNILLNSTDSILLENNSSLRKGTYDFGQGGGVSRVCGVDYEDMWQGGIRYVFDNNGYIRNATNCFELTPEPTFDITKRFKIGSIWTLDDGTNYICTDATEAAAVWELYNVIPDVTGFVPYTGATEDVNLGEFGLLTGNIEFDNTPTNIPTTSGAMYWNDADGTADLILKGGNVKLQVGQESVLRVVNKTATNINLLEANYQAVRVTGAQGQRLKVDLAQATTDNLSAETIGLVTETINNNQEGFITTSGLVRNINTTGSLQGETWADGDILYLSPTTAGNVTKVKPTAPNHLVIVGYVVHAHANQGSIFVKVDNGYELDELHNVKITSAANNNVLAYTSATDIWENKTVETALGYTPFQLPSLTSGSVLFSNGTTIAQKNASFFWDNTNNRLGIGTTTPATALDVNGTIRASTLRADVLNNTANTVTLIQFTGTGNRLFDNSGVQVANIRNSNFQIGTTTDAGFKLDVNGTARVQGNTTIVAATPVLNVNVTANTQTSALYFNALDGTPRAGIMANIATGEIRYLATATGYFPTFYSNNVERMRIATTGNVLINTTTDIASSQLTIASTTKGFLPPRMTTTQKNAIATPAAGLVVYDTTLNKLCLYTTTWETITSL
jgi:hypothetical protein